MNDEDSDVDKEINEIAYGLSNFKGLGNNQLSFSKGDELHILKKSTEYWWWAELDGRFGYVPVNHLVLSSYQEFCWQDDEYFGQYGCLKLHHEMLNDKPRNLAYESAVKKNAKHLEDKVVMDIGCGTGILSMMVAKYSKARKIYAVEASEMAEHADRLVKSNGFNDVITVLHSYVEDVEVDEKVDVIISEWMGTALLFEMMIESVILARDRLLKDDGTVWPSLASLFIVPCSADEVYANKMEFWDNQYGFDFTPLKCLAKSEFLGRPIHNHVLSLSDCLSEENCVFSFNMKSVTISDLENICGDFRFVVVRTGKLHGFTTWFEVRFCKIQNGVDDVILNTGPHHELTHWKQNLFLLNEPLMVECGDVISGFFNLYRNKEWRRHLFAKIRFDLLRKDEVLNSVEKLFSIWRPEENKDKS